MIRRRRRAALGQLSFGSRVSAQASSDQSLDTSQLDVRKTSEPGFCVWCCRAIVNVRHPGVKVSVWLAVKTSPPLVRCGICAVISIRGTNFSGAFFQSSLFSFRQGIPSFFCYLQTPCKCLSHFIKLQSQQPTRATRQVKRGSCVAGAKNTHGIGDVEKRRSRRNPGADRK